LQVAVLGTGTMGAPMAVNVAAAGESVSAWNRTPERAQSLDGIHAAATVEEAVDGAELVITMLADGGAVEEVAREALPAMNGAVWVQMSTVGIAATERLAALAEERGVAFVDAPVIGTRQPAERGELVVLASGPRDARERAKPVFDAVGARTVELGDAGDGTRLKVVANSWLVGLVAALGEAIALSESIGLDPRVFLDTIEGGPLGPPYARLKGDLMVEREFPTSFALGLARKDAGLVLEAAERTGLDARLTRAVVELFDRAAGAGHGDDDMAAIVEAGRG
jgi:3-hydroxyisobutyrate dehydrogenase